MAAVTAAPEDESSAIGVERMLDDGAPTNVPRRIRKSRWSPVHLLDEASADERAAQRRASRHVFRLYCLACGRSTEVLIVPVRPGRCEHCGGTMLTQVTAAD